MVVMAPQLLWSPPLHSLTVFVSLLEVKTWSFGCGGWPCLVVGARVRFQVRAVGLEARDVREDAQRVAERYLAVFVIYVVSVLL